MGFRDDKEALRAQVEALRQALEDQTRRADEKQDARLEELESELAELRQRQKHSDRVSALTVLQTAVPYLLIAVVVSAVCSVAITNVLLNDRNPVARVVKEPDAKATARPKVGAAARFVGAVTSVEGSGALKVGDRCSMTVPDEGSLSNGRCSSIAIECGGQTVYSLRNIRRHKVSQGEELDCGVKGQVERDGGLYTVQHFDTNTSPDRLNAQIDTIHRKVRLWDDGTQIAIRLDHAAARTRNTTPYAEPRMTLKALGGFGATATVSESTGPLSVGQSCRLVVEKTPSHWPRSLRLVYPQNCTVSFRCGKIKFSEAAHCEVDEMLNVRKVVTREKEGAPEISATKSEATLTSRFAEPAWSASFTLEVD